MGSRKEEERNEKIIRGLMKLPPNRRCINCNSVGPQYVCTDFWTFVCMTCSGIHREFTHRVKSVSMSKFTSQEVEALQNGGNQRAREVYLKDWDPQRQRLPDNSSAYNNINKVREFIKHVYIDRIYAGGKNSDKPPKDTQGLGSQLDETRRASSYHSYSQSPPYDYQYEERRYGKHRAVLTRKPGSDRGNYVGKISSLVHSPAGMSEQMFEDSASSIADYSESSGGDTFTSGTQSPNFEKDVGFKSSPVHPARNMSSLKSTFKRDVDGIPHPKRATSLGSLGSFERNSLSIKSYSSGGLTDIVSEHKQAAGTHLDKVSTFPKSHGSVSYGGLDLFEAPFKPEHISSAVPPIGLFQLPETSGASVNMFQTSQASSAPSVNTYQLTQISSPSTLDFFHIPEQPSTTALDRNPQVLAIPKNEGWATFDTSPPAASIPGTESRSTSIVPRNEGSSAKFDQLSSSNTSMLWPAFQNPTANGSSLLSEPWPGNLHNVQTPANARSTDVVPGTESLSTATVPSNGGSAVNFDQFPSPNTSMQWPSFRSSFAIEPSPSCDPWPGLLNVQAPAIAKSPEPPLEDVKQNSELHLYVYKLSPTPDRYLTIIPLVAATTTLSCEGSVETIDYAKLRVAFHDGPPNQSLQSHADMWPSYTPSVPPLMGEMLAHATGHKSVNPFDFPCDSELEHSNMFLDMNSLQAALPSAELSPPFLVGTAQSWFTQNPVPPLVPAAVQGGLAYLSGQASTVQLPNIPTREPVASVGGNPFA